MGKESPNFAEVKSSGRKITAPNKTNLCHRNLFLDQRTTKNAGGRGRGEDQGLPHPVPVDRQLRNVRSDGLLLTSHSILPIFLRVLHIYTKRQSQTLIKVYRCYL